MVAVRGVEGSAPDLPASARRRTLPARLLVRSVRFNRPMISGDRALKIERQLAQLLDVEVDELRDYLAGNIRTSSTRPTGFRFVRGTHGGHYVRDREGTDMRPAGVSVR